MNWLREPDGEPLPGYRLIEPIGTGGFGEVWKCVAPGGIHKAIKFVYGNLNALDGDDARAVQELKALERVKQVRHPFVVSIEQIQDVGGELVIVMELADRNLHECLVEYQSAGRPGIPRDILLGFLDDAAIGLDHLIEKHNLQHLDVKPRNLFMVADRVKVADFGLVKQLERSSSSGLMGGVTPIYAAPETFQNKISKHSDQYSLAIVYVELLTGKRPFPGKNIRQLALQHMSEPPDLSMLPEGDQPVVARALAKNPDERWPSCTAFVRALGGARDASGSSGGGEAGSGVREPGAWARTGRTVHDVELTPSVSAPGRGAAAVMSGPARPHSAPQEHPEIDEDHLLGVTAAQKEVGVLRPTILIGVGSFGRRALQEIRCRLTDRVGDVVQVPCFRFLYVDCDPDAATKAVSAPPDVALGADEVFSVPLQPVTQYRRRQLEQILDWLPREKLYAIPRSLRAGGARALGRLAFCDNYLRFVTRLRREFQIATHPESLAQSSDQTGLTVRDNTPQVYVFASASGGSGGMLVDLGYAVRRVLARVTPTDAPVTAFVYAAAPEDPNSTDAELANLYAALTELNHFSDPEVPFVAHYGGPEGPKVESRGLPFTSTYLMPMAERSAGSFRDCLSHLAGYVSHDMTTPLGPALEQLRSRPVGFDRSPFRSFGTYGVWFPRGLLLRAAAQKICLRLLKEWKVDADPTDPTPVQQVVGHAVNDSRLKPDAVRAQIEQEAVRGPDGGPGDQIERWLSGLEAQLGATTRRPDAGAWSRAVWEQARDLIGTRPTGEQDSTVRRSRTSKLLEEAVKRVAEMWGNEFAEIVRPLEEFPGRRLGAIGTALKKLAAASTEWAAAAAARAQQFAVKARQAKSDVQSAHDVCQAGSGTFSFFGGRTGRSMRHFLDQIRAFAHVRLQEDLADATAKFYRALRARIEDRLRELAYCRTRMELLIDVMESPLANLPPSSDTPVALSEEALQQTLRPTNTLNVVLPSGETHIERSAKRVVNSVKPQDVLRLEVALQKLVLEPRGGLTALCQLNADMSRTLVAPMVEQTTAFLSDLLPVTDVTEVEVSTSRARNVDLSTRIHDYHARSAPPCGSETGAQTFVLVPETESGNAFAGLVKKAVPNALTIAVNGAATDLMFCREHGNLLPAEVAALLAACQPAYYEALATAQTSPHSRFDVTEWLPLSE
ncbi:protein kinase [Gemmata sp. G18]|uniref:Protein kinase n=1 Tax=Gemmata palustris TaxID=2822762 RepID=A0ABS5C3J0_9BACT|nr:tubulin-like doman-containing protein [Gemmata palustris]MBP3960405.1 protein kinase [Gemmata palustris]